MPLLAKHILIKDSPRKSMTTRQGVSDVRMTKD